jgi:4-diphosphocytidyl-2-C-methyl-D-erythritol kinase
MLVVREAPAKINLFLHVLGRRADGLHDIDTLLLPLVLCDRLELEIEAAPEGELDVSCSCPGRPTLDGETNLAARAVRRFLEASGRSARVSITIHKRIWVAAGLGGGSSDAATALLALEGAAAFGNLGPERLHRLAASLGADIPFFLNPRPTRATGTGDRLAPVPGIPAVDLVLANPGIPLSTADVYHGLGLVPGTRFPYTAPPGDWPGSVTSSELAGMIHNDLEKVAFSLRPEAREIKQLLRDLGAIDAGMTGSGATVFGIFESSKTASRAADKILKSTGFLAVSSRTVAA